MIDPRLAKIKEEYVNSAAYHKAGHTVIAAVQGLWLRARGIHVDPEGSGISYYAHRMPGDLSNSAKDQDERGRTILALHAGRIAQVRVFPECPDESWAADAGVIGALLEEMFGADLRARSAAETLRQQSQELVGRRWASIDSLATGLLSKSWTEQPPIEIKENWSQGRSRLERWMPGSEVVRILSGFGIVAELRESDGLRLPPFPTPRLS
jgi:hypothetical protein